MAYPDLTALKALVRDLLGETTAAFFTDAEIIRWLNDGECDVAAKTLCLEAIEQVTTVNATRGYAVTAVKLLYAEYQPASGTRTGLIKITPTRIGHVIDASRTVPQAWFPFAGKINVDPIPNGAYYVNVYKAILPTASMVYDTASIRSTAYKWSASGSGTNEYYCELTAGGNPSLSDPDNCTINGTLATEGTLGSLAAGRWGYGDNDSLGYSTVYVRLSDGADPDTKAADFITLADVPEIPRPALPLLVKFAHWRGLLKDKKYGAADRIYRDYIASCLKLRYEIVQKYRDAKLDLALPERIVAAKEG